MSARIFLDTNTLVYILEGKEPSPDIILRPDEMEANHMMLAAALEARCTTFYSEDMQDGQVIEKTMTIKNPFKA